MKPRIWHQFGIWVELQNNNTIRKCHAANMIPVEANFPKTKCIYELWEFRHGNSGGECKRYTNHVDELFKSNGNVQYTPAAFALHLLNGNQYPLIVVGGSRLVLHIIP